MNSIDPVADPALQKAELRRSLLKTRRALPPEQWQQRSQQICDRLQAWSGFAQARTALSYFSIRQEPDLGPLLALPLQWGLPRCAGADLSWHVWAPGEPLETGSFGISEPLASAPAIDPDAVDLILVPAVACDRRGYRLGYGGGFYDRLLSQPAWRDKLTIGIVFEFAHLPQLPTQVWDLPLRGVCTEAGLFSADSEAELRLS